MTEDPFIRWCRYYWNTEWFDRTVCNAISPRSGLAMPVTPEQRAVCTRNARRELHEQGLERCREGRDEASRLTMEGLRRVLYPDAP